MHFCAAKDCASFAAEGFGVGHTRSTQTKGVWVWGEPQKLPLADKTLPEFGGQEASIVYLDTEGFESTGKADAYDDRIFALSTLISAVLVYNLPETVRESDIQKLSFAVELAEGFYADVQVSLPTSPAWSHVAECHGKPHDEQQLLQKDNSTMSRHAAGHLNSSQCIGATITDVCMPAPTLHACTCKKVYTQEDVHSRRCALEKMCTQEDVHHDLCDGCRGAGVAARWNLATCCGSFRETSCRAKLSKTWSLKPCFLWQTPMRTKTLLRSTYYTVKAANRMTTLFVSLLALTTEPHGHGISHLHVAGQQGMQVLCLIPCSTPCFKLH